MGNPIVVLNSELVTLLDADELRTVLAHEAAHVHSDHVLYRTALLILLRLSANLPILAGLPLLAIRSRCSSGSAPPSCPATAPRRW